MTGEESTCVCLSLFPASLLLVISCLFSLVVLVMWVYLEERFDVDSASRGRELRRRRWRVLLLPSQRSREKGSISENKRG